MCCRPDDARDGYEVDEHTMPVVRRIFRMAGVDGLSVNGIKRALDAEGVPTPSGRKYWHWRAIQSFIMDDVYRPHDFEEVVDLVMPEVAATLNPGERYGVWWYNRQRVKRSQVSEAGPGGRIYRKRASTPSRTEASGSRSRCPTRGYLGRCWRPHGGPFSATVPLPGPQEGFGNSPAPSCAAPGAGGR
ncbi:MAG: recombinase family protein [Actinomycetota bacterium]|nr:recombinase family protein [Actinomycetota bacterium]